MKRLCEIARSSFYAWLAAAPGRAARVTADVVLASRIRVLQDPRRVVTRLRRAPDHRRPQRGATASDRANHKRVARVIQQHQLAGIRLRQRLKTTIPDQNQWALTLDRGHGVIRLCRFREGSEAGGFVGVRADVADLGVASPGVLAVCPGEHGAIGGGPDGERRSSGEELPLERGVEAFRQ